MTTYNTLLTATGLSLREAAAFHDVRLDTVKSWSVGRNSTPEGVLSELRQLLVMQLKAAEAGATQIRTIVAERGAPEEIELGLASDDYEAQTLGWPCASAHKVVLGMTIAYLARYPTSDLGARVVVVPRGSTLGTAAAELK